MGFDSALGEIKLRGLLTVEKRYTGITRRTQDMTPAWRRIDKSVTTVLTRQHATKGAFGGQSWAPLRPATVKARQRPGGNRGGVGHPLWDFGRLRASLIMVGPESIRVITKDRYVRGTRVPYAVRHQEGFTVTEWGGQKFKHPRKVPARQLIPDPMPEHIRATWLRIAALHVGGN